MKQAMWKKWVCAGLLASAAFFSGCGSEDKVAVVDYQRLEAESPRIQSIEKEIGTKNQEISDRLAKEQSSLSQEDYQKKQRQPSRNVRSLCRASKSRCSH